MLNESASQLRLRLRDLGLSTQVINAAWPTWWSEDADASISAKAELRFSLSRKLGLDPKSLLEDGQPRYLWNDVARFKHLADETELEKSAITAFGAAVSRVLLGATMPSQSTANVTASEMRRLILQSHPFVRLLDLLSLCWSLGIPIIHLRIFPLSTKRMSAMAVRVGSRSAVLVGKDSLYPPHIAFYVAHELAHIALGHLEDTAVVVDLERNALALSGTDKEEEAADKYALDLLTGETEPIVLSLTGAASSQALARVALNSSTDLGIEPGVLALCFGYSTQNWSIANGAMQYIYQSEKPAWKEINGVAREQISFDLIARDSRTYLEKVLGDITA